MFRARLFTPALLLVATVFLGSGCLQVSEIRYDEKKCEKDGVLIHITHGDNDPHRVLTALDMAGRMAGIKEVLVYFDIEGVSVVLKDSEDLQYSHFSSSKTQIRKLLDKGVNIYVCPGDLKAAGKGPEDVAEGVRIAKKEDLFNFTRGRILTLDY